MKKTTGIPNLLQNFSEIMSKETRMPKENKKALKKSSSKSGTLSRGKPKAPRGPLLTPVESANNVHLTPISGPLEEPINENFLGPQVMSVVNLVTDESMTVLPQIFRSDEHTNISDTFYKAYYGQGPLIQMEEKIIRLQWKKYAHASTSYSSLPQASLEEIKDDPIQAPENPIEVITPSNPTTVLSKISVLSGTSNYRTSTDLESSTSSESIPPPPLNLDSSKPTNIPQHEIFAKLMQMLGSAKVPVDQLSAEWSVFLYDYCASEEVYVTTNRGSIVSEPTQINNLRKPKNLLQELFLVLFQGFSTCLSLKELDKIQEREDERLALLLEETHLEEKLSDSGSLSPVIPKEPEIIPEKSERVPKEVVIGRFKYKPIQYVDSGPATVDEAQPSTSRVESKVPVEKQVEIRHSPRIRKIFWVAFKKGTASRVKGSVMSSLQLQVGALGEFAAKQLIAQSGASSALKNQINFKKFSVYRIE